MLKKQADAVGKASITAGADADLRSRRHVGRPVVITIGLGVVSVMAGLAPWIITGMRLPAPTLWDQPSGGVDTRLVILPLNQYSAALLASLLLVGGAVAGISFRLLRRRKHLELRRAHMFILAGVVVGLQAVALAQTAVTALTAQRARMGTDPVMWAPSASRFTVPQEYTVALLAGAALSILLAAVLLVLLACAPPGVALVAFAVASLAVGTWISGFVVPVGAFATESNDVVLAVVRWVPPLLVGCSIALRGVDSRRRFTGAIVSVLVLWLGGAGVAAVVAILGRLAYRPSVTGLLGYVARMLINALGLQGEGPTLIAAVIIAVIGVTTARWILRLTPLFSRPGFAPKTVGRYR